MRLYTFKASRLAALLFALAKNLSVMRQIGASVGHILKRWCYAVP